MLFERDVYQTIVTALFCASKVNGLQRSLLNSRKDFHFKLHKSNGQFLWYSFVIQSLSFHSFHLHKTNLTE